MQNRPPGKLFFTNAVLCLKRDGVQGDLRPEWVRNSQLFLQRLIEIVNPKLVVCLGKQAYLAVMGTYGLKAGPFRKAVENSVPVELACGSRVLAVYHCGRRMLNTHRHEDEQREDWRRIGVFRKLSGEDGRDA